MGWISFAVLLALLITFVNCKECPAIYKRFSIEHSFCQIGNGSCSIIRKGLSKNDKKLIVDLHNSYRNKVAMGLENGAGGLPSASNMLQMVWDEELSSIAQKTAEKCQFKHDCDSCREVHNFRVGQNIGYRGGSCRRADCFRSSAPKWNEPLKLFFNEVSIFDKKYIKAVFYPTNKVFGHFTQMIWATTWRVGCGFAAYKRGSGFGQFYVCNYGPKGNVINKPIYEVGKPCSSCPINSCCGSSCISPEFSGLCRMIKYDEPPVFPRRPNYIYDCRFRKTVGECAVSAEGIRNWKFIQALGGPFAEIVLKGGEQSILKFKRPIKHSINFCLLIQFRTGPTIAGERFSNNMTLSLTVSKKSRILILPTESRSGFLNFNVDASWTGETKVAFVVSVPTNAPPQYFNIKQVSAMNGSCKL